MKTIGNWKFILRTLGMSSILAAFILIYVTTLAATAFAESTQPAQAISTSAPILIPGGCGLVGDVNYNGKVDGSDLSELIAHWRGNSINERARYDLTHDGRVTVASAIKLLIKLNEECPYSPMGIQMFSEYSRLENNGRAKALQGDLRWARLYLFSWQLMEPNDGDPQAWWWYDFLVQQAQLDGMRIIATIQGNPDWAATTTCGPIDKVALSRYTDFVLKLVRRYGGNGGAASMPGLTTPIKFWEFGNEPDWDRVENAPGSCFGGNVNAAINPAPDAHEYADMLKALYLAIKGVDPTAQVVFGSVAYDYSENLHFSMDFTDKVLQRLSADPNVGANNCYFDVMGFHQYDSYRTNWDSLNRPFNQGLLAKANAVKSILSGYNYCANKPLMITEIGMQIGDTGQQDDPIQMEIQARHIARMYFQVYATRAQVAIWYTLEDQDEEFKYGLFPSGSTVGRPAYFVIRNLSELMKGYTFAQQIDIGNPNVQAFVFTKDSNPAHKRIALWYDNGQRIKLLSPPDSFSTIARIQSTLFSDWNGRVKVTKRTPQPPNYSLNYTPTIVSSANNPYVEISVTSDPVIVETDILLP